MKIQLNSLLVGASCALLPVSAFAQFQFLSGTSLANAGGEISISTTRSGLLMRDTIATFQKGGQTYILTANEGDARDDGADETRLSGNRRLTVVANGIEGATNMYGTRSASIVRASDGVVVWDSSDRQGTAAAFKSFEEYIRDNDKATFGMDQNSAFAFRPASAGAVYNFDTGLFTNGATDATLAANSETRSDNKSPEPKSIAFGSANVRDFMFAGMERQGGIFGFDITDLNNISLIGYINLVERTASLGQLYLSPRNDSVRRCGVQPHGQEYSPARLREPHPGLRRHRRHRRFGDDLRDP